MVPVSVFAQDGAQSARDGGTAATASDDRAIAQTMLGTGRITQDRSRAQCLAKGRPGEIVVCAPDEEANRIPPTSSDPNSPEALRDGRLHTPDVAGKGIFKGKSTLTFGSIEAPYMIDLSSIPEAPAGSDADKIAKGELRAP